MKRLKSYKNCPLEREAFRAQARYIGLAPRFYSPSIHNIDRLSNIRIEESDSDNETENNVENQNTTDEDIKNASSQATDTHLHTQTNLHLGARLNQAA